MIQVDNENLVNGYMYKQLCNKIDNLEKNVREIVKLIDEANSNMRITVKDYVSIVKILNEKADNDLLIKHMEDNQMHHIRGRDNDVIYIQPEGPSEEDKKLNDRLDKLENIVINLADKVNEIPEIISYTNEELKNIILSKND